MEKKPLIVQPSHAEVIRHGPLTLDLANYKLIGVERTEYLTLLQARLLAVLMGEPGKVHSIHALSSIEPDSPMTENAVKISLSRIRRCLDRLGCGERYLHSVRNLGYLFDAD